jgi:hypothetical protein
VAMVARRLLGAIGVGGDVVPVAIGFVNGALTWELIKRAPILGLGKIFVTPIGYVLAGGGKLVESVAVSDATYLGLLANIMLTPRPRPAVQERVERARPHIETVALSAWRQTFTAPPATSFTTQPAPRPIARPFMIRR